MAINNVKETTEVVTERKRSALGKELAGFLHDAVDLATEEELPGLALLMLRWLDENEYKLQGTPEEMLLKMQERAK